MEAISNDILNKINSYKKDRIHQLSPYVGKIRPELARYLVEAYCPKDGIVWDPFCGSGTIPFEAWKSGRRAFATDLNLYAVVLTKGKLNPPRSLDLALDKIKFYNKIVIEKQLNFDNNYLPNWLFDFFHPLTLIETFIWSKVLYENEEWFLLSCLLGILHHQRPGFLSYPCSHGAPYLRNKKYPKELFPEMYDYRNVLTRLIDKVKRTLRDSNKLDFLVERKVFLQSASDTLTCQSHINTIITSPPYMKALTYARDNRLRLWFLGFRDWQVLDKTISPSKIDFKELMKCSIQSWANYQVSGDKCIFIIGDMLIDKRSNVSLSEYITSITSIHNYKLINVFKDSIPEARKVVKGNERIKDEHICIFEKF